MDKDIKKIRKFLIEILQKKKAIHLFANYFTRMEENFAERDLSDNLKNFLMFYLTIYTDWTILRQSTLDIVFKYFYEYAKNIKSDEEILNHLYRYSNYYLMLIETNIDDFDIKMTINKINELGAFDTYPYLMQALEDYEMSHITKNIFLDILETVVNYLEIRNKADKKIIPFAKITEELNKMLAMKDYVPLLDKQEKNYSEPTKIENTSDISIEIQFRNRPKENNLNKKRLTINDLINKH